MKIYFAGSIRGGRDDVDIYNAIIKLLQDMGHSVLTEHIGLASLTSSGEKKTEQEIFERDMAWVREADAIVAEVTNPSLGVGYELGQAEAMGKKIICLFRETGERSLSAMIAGNQKLVVFRYKEIDELSDILKSSV